MEEVLKGNKTALDMWLEWEVTQGTIAAYVKALVVWIRATKPKSILSNLASGLHLVFGVPFAPLLLVQFVTTIILGLLVEVTFGLLLIPMSILLWWPFLCFLLASSWLWDKVRFIQIILLLPGVLIAETTLAIVALMPSMGEWRSRGHKLAICESWPHSLSTFLLTNAISKNEVVM